MKPTPTCPRCGYDQGGAIEAWERIEPRACPLDGLCTECGLAFLWADLLNPRLAGPPWSYEAHRSRLGGNLWRTIARCFRPRRLWSEMRLEHPVRLRRAMRVAVVGIVLLHALAAVANVGFWSAVFAICPQTYGPRVFTPQGFVSPNKVVIPSTGGVIRTTAGGAEVLKYSVEKGVRGSLWPYGSRWVRTYSDGIDPWMALVIGMAALVPLAFAALPVTLRRARVRPRHLARIWVYSLVPLPLVLYAWVPVTSLYLSVLNNWNTGLRRPPFPLSVFATPLCRALIAVVVAYLWLWWTAAATHYLRLPHARRIVLAMLAIAFLGAAAIVMANPRYNSGILAGL